MSQRSSYLSLRSWRVQCHPCFRVRVNRQLPSEWATAWAGHAVPHCEYGTALLHPLNQHLVTGGMPGSPPTLHLGVF